MMYRTIPCNLTQNVVDVKHILYYLYGSRYMQKDSKEKHKGFGDFFPLHTDAFEKNVKVITMAQFLEIEGGDEGQFPIPEDDRADVLKTADECDKRAKSDIACNHVFDYLEASAFVPQFNSSICVVFDEDALEHGSVSDENKDRVEKFCDPRLVRLMHVTYYLLLMI